MKNLLFPLSEQSLGTYTGVMGIGTIFFRSTEPRILVKIYEKWIRVVSVELEKAGVIEKVYEPLNVDEMSFVDVINRSDYYLKNDDE